MRCQHTEHDCADLACPCLCTRCIDDRLAIYSDMGIGLLARPDPLWGRIRRALRLPEK